MQPTEQNLTAAERDQLNAADALTVERWIQNEGNTLEAVTSGTRSRMRQAHKILDRKVDEERRALLADRPADFPKTQVVG